jgi:hypothetical protein
MACIALGCLVGVLGSRVSGSAWWYLAIPGAVAAAWLFVADPQRCARRNEPRPRGPGGAA